MSSPVRRPRAVLRRVVAVPAASLLMLAAGASIASAHVTVSAPGAVSGGSDQLVTFRVPNESNSLSTVGVKVQLPAATPIASVLVLPVAGWTAKISTTKLVKPIETDDGQITEAVTEIDWSASNATAAIKPGQFGQFVIIAGQLPEANSLIFKAVQAYSDGTSVSWIDVAAPGSATEPERPAPVLSLGKAPATSSVSPGSSSSVSPAAPSAPQAASSSNSASKAAATTGIILGVIGVLLGGAGLFFALRRRPAAG